MAGKMTGAKGMAAAKMKNAFPPPHKNPRSAHIREANGGYIMSAHGGNGDPMGQDHVAPDMASIMSKLQSHMTGDGGGQDAPEEMSESPQDDTAAEEQPEAETAPAVKKPVKKAAKASAKKKVKIKIRDQSETY